jgi:hypothetical protein
MGLDIIWAETLRHRCTLYRALINPNSDGRGEPAMSGYTVIATDFAYLNYSTRNFSQPSEIGRVLQPSVISVQWGYSTPDAPWEDGDLLRDTTAGGLLFGVVFRILGPPTRYDSIPLDIAESAFSNVELRQLPRAPVGLPA